MKPKPWVGAMVQFCRGGEVLAAVVTKVHPMPKLDPPWRDPVDLGVFLVGGGIRPQRMIESVSPVATDPDGFWRWPPEAFR